MVGSRKQVGLQTVPGPWEWLHAGGKGMSDSGTWTPREEAGGPPTSAMATCIRGRQAAHVNLGRPPTSDSTAAEGRARGPTLLRLRVGSVAGLAWLASRTAVQ